MKLQKRLIKLLLILVAMFNFGIGNVNAARDYDRNESIVDAQRPEDMSTQDEILTCTDPRVLESVKVIGYAVNVIKIVVPIILIIGTIKGLVNAILAQDDKGISEQTSKFIKKFVLAVFIFFIPTILYTILGYVDSYDTSSERYTDCAKCLVYSPECDTLIDAALTSDGLTEEEYKGWCTSLFGNPNDPEKKDTAYFLQLVLNVFKYIAIVAFVALTSVDFAKAIIGDDKDMIKPLTSKAFNRMIYAVLLFFLPTIVEILLSLIGVYGSCGIG